MLDEPAANLDEKALQLLHDLLLKSNQVLSMLDLLKYKDKHPMSLSGGQKQRLAVATAILSERDVLVFDEPTSGLDYRRMKRMGDMMQE